MIGRTQRGKSIRAGEAGKICALERQGGVGQSGRWVVRVSGENFLKEGVGPTHENCEEKNA